MLSCESMQRFKTLTSLAVPLDRPQVDTDQIIPKQFLRSIKRSGFGPFLFDEWRYMDRGELGMDCSQRPKNMEFSLNQPRFAGAQILLARDNFGCGSSREHAVWALADFGFRAVIAPSFGDIFATNAVKNGFLTIRLPASIIDSLFANINAMHDSSIALTIDLEAQNVCEEGEGGKAYHFDIDADDKNRLLNGLDDIAITLQHRDKILSYEKQRQQIEPWLFHRK